MASAVKGGDAQKTITPSDISVNVFKVAANSMLAGSSGLLWGYFRHHRQLRQQTVVPIAGTSPRAFAAATLTAMYCVSVTIVVAT